MQFTIIIRTNRLCYISVVVSEIYTHDIHCGTSPKLLRFLSVFHTYRVSTKECYWYSTVFYPHYNICKWTDVTRMVTVIFTSFPQVWMVYVKSPLYSVLNYKMVFKIHQVTFFGGHTVENRITISAIQCKQIFIYFKTWTRIPALIFLFYMSFPQGPASRLEFLFCERIVSLWRVILHTAPLLRFNRQFKFSTNKFMKSVTVLSVCEIMHLMVTTSTLLNSVYLSVWYLLLALSG